MLTIPRLLVGVALSTLGRKLFWLFVAGVGFLSAMSLASRWLEGSPDWLVIGLGIVAGLIGALLAIFVQKVAVVLAGFLAGGFLLLGLVNLMGFELAAASWLAFIVGGILGAILMTAAFDWALILLSSLAGASLISDALVGGQSIYPIVYIGVLILGIVVQAVIMRQEKRGAS
jgi:hypothetical protein